MDLNICGESAVLDSNSLFYYLLHISRNSLFYGENSQEGMITQTMIGMWSTCWRKAQSLYLYITAHFEIEKLTRSVSQTKKHLNCLLTGMSHRKDKYLHLRFSGVPVNFSICVQIRGLQNRQKYCFRNTEAITKKKRIQEGHLDC